MSVTEEGASATCSVRRLTALTSAVGTSTTLSSWTCLSVSTLTSRSMVAKPGRLIRTWRTPVGTICATVGV
jgi:hypothetical protein